MSEKSKAPELRSVEFITRDEFDTILGRINLYAANCKTKFKEADERFMRTAIRDCVVSYLSLHYPHYMDRRIVVVDDVDKLVELKRMSKSYNDEKLEEMFKNDSDAKLNLISECVDGFMPYKTAKA